MIVDNPTQAQAKRWLFQCYRYVDWCNTEEVQNLFVPLRMYLIQMTYHEREGQLEVRCGIDTITDYEAFYTSISRVVHHHGAQFLDAKVTVERPVEQHLHPADRIAYQYRGRESVEVSVWVRPPRAARTFLGEVVAAPAARYAQLFGHGARDGPEPNWF